MSLHYPFEYLQHKLWPKEGSGIKVSIRFLTIKSQKLPQIMCVQAVCHISLKNLDESYNFALDLTSIKGLH